MLLDDLTPFSRTGPDSPIKSLTGCLANAEKSYWESNPSAKSSKVTGMDRGRPTRDGFFFWLRGRPLTGREEAGCIPFFPFCGFGFFLKSTWKLIELLLSQYSTPLTAYLTQKN